jgi:hypothetical protein
MGIEGPSLSPGKGRWPKDPAKRARRRQQIEVACVYKQTLDANGGFSRSRGAASKCQSVELTDDEKAAILKRHGG